MWYSGLLINGEVIQHMEEDLSNPGSIMFSVMYGDDEAGYLGITDGITHYSSVNLTTSATDLSYQTSINETIEVLSFRQVSPNTLIIELGKTETGRTDISATSRGCLCHFNRHTNGMQLLGDDHCVDPPQSNLLDFLVDSQNTQLLYKMKSRGLWVMNITSQTKIFTLFHDFSSNSSNQRYIPVVLSQYRDYLYTGSYDNLQDELTVKVKRGQSDIKYFTINAQY